MIRVSLLSVLFIALLFTSCSNTEEPIAKNIKDHKVKDVAEDTTDQIPFQDDPETHAIYDQMNTAMSKADSLSFVGKYRREINNDIKSECTYQVWLKKPNYFRIETKSVSGEQGGILVGDGDTMWLYWPKGRPEWKYVTESEADKKTRFNSYMTKPAPPRKHSIWHEMVFLGYGMSTPILELSTFHGFKDSFQDYLDGVQHLGTENVAGEECDKIEVSLMKQQRIWYLWLSKRDHLPRKLQEIVHADCDVVTNEQWSAVTVDADIPEAMFSWVPPKDWIQWKLPNGKGLLIKSGSKAPDFSLTSIDGERIKLSDYRGKVVLLCFWRVGCSPCRVEIPHMQDLYAKYKDKGLVVLGMNVLDNREITSKYLYEQNVTFPCILDKSETARKVYFEDYNVGAIPTNYVINADGNVVDAWIGYEDDLKAIEALGKTGGDLAKTLHQEWHGETKR